MQPLAFTVNIDPRLISMGYIGLCQLVFTDLLEVRQIFKGLNIKVENRALTDRNL